MEQDTNTLVQKIADYCNAHPDSMISDAARRLGMEYWRVQQMHLLAVKAGLVQKQKRGKWQKHSEKTLQEVRMVADYINTHPGCGIVDAARALGMNYLPTRHRYLLAVEQGFVKPQNFRRGRPAADLEQVALAGSMYVNGRSLRQIGGELGKSSRTVLRYVKGCVKLGIITREQRAAARVFNYKRRAVVRGREGWEYFLDLARNIEGLSRDDFPELRKRHFGRYCITRQRFLVLRSEHACLEALVANGRLSNDDAELMRCIIHRQKISPMSLRRLKALSKDALKEGMTLKKLAFKYGLAPRNCVNPGNHVQDYVQYAIELGLLDQDAYNAKALENIGPERKHPISAIEEVIRKHGKTGKPWTVLAREAGIPAATAYQYYVKQKKAQSESK